MWNAVLFTGVYTPLFPPERVLCHNWYLMFPYVDMVSFFSPNFILPFAIAFVVARQYLSHIDSNKICFTLRLHTSILPPFLFYFY